MLDKMYSLMISNEIKKYNKSKNPAKLEKIANEVAKTYNAEKCYDVARYLGNVEGVNIKPLEDVVLKTNLPELSFKFAKNVSRANILAHQKVVMNSGDMWLTMDFARDVKDANLTAISKFVSASEDTYCKALYHKIEKNKKEEKTL